MVALVRCTRCVAKLHYDEDKMDWRNDAGRPVCPQGGPHRVFTPKADWDAIPSLLTEWQEE
jgi:hypothetical protein